MVAVTPPSGSGASVLGVGLVQDVDSMQDYLSSIWRNQEGSHGNTVFWEVQYVPLNREFCVAVMKFCRKKCGVMRVTFTIINVAGVTANLKMFNTRSAAIFC